MVNPPRYYLVAMLDYRAVIPTVRTLSSRPKGEILRVRDSTWTKDFLPREEHVSASRQA